MAARRSFELRDLERPIQFSVRRRATRSPDATRTGQSHLQMSGNGRRVQPLAGMCFGSPRAWFSFVPSRPGDALQPARRSSIASA